MQPGNSKTSNHTLSNISRELRRPQTASEAGIPFQSPIKPYRKILNPKLLKQNKDNNEEVNDADKRITAHYSKNPKKHTLQHLKLGLSLAQKQSESKIAIRGKLGDIYAAQDIKITTPSCSITKSIIFYSNTVNPIESRLSTIVHSKGLSQFLGYQLFWGRQHIEISLNTNVLPNQEKYQTIEVKTNVPDEYLRKYMMNLRSLQDDPERIINNIYENDSKNTHQKPYFLFTNDNTADEEFRTLLDITKKVNAPHR